MDYMSRKCDFCGITSAVSPQTTACPECSGYYPSMWLNEPVSRTKHNTSHRPQILPVEIDDSIKQIQKDLQRVLEKKGYGSFVSIHEISGVLTEEYHEFLEEVHSKDKSKQINELIDVACTAIFGIACLKSNKTDW